jgi:hypothetical protein
MTHQNSRLSMPDQDRSLKLLDLNVPTLGYNSKKKEEFIQNKTK